MERERAHKFKLTAGIIERMGRRVPGICKVDRRQAKNRGLTRKYASPFQTDIMWLGLRHFLKHFYEGPFWIVMETR